MSWFTAASAKPVLTSVEKACQSVDAKNLLNIQLYADAYELDGVTWYDIDQKGLEAERKWLVMRGLIIVHPITHNLVREV